MIMVILQLTHSNLLEEMNLNRNLPEKMNLNVLIGYSYSYGYSDVYDYLHNLQNIRSF